jgi:SNF2 family DNA or RNA helicase
MNSIRTIRQHLEMFQQTFSNALTPDSPLAPQPQHIQLPLRIHQLAAVDAMRKKELALQRGLQIDQTTLFSKYAFLGDRTGTGKTLITLAHISQMATYPLTEESRLPLSNLHPLSSSACFSITPQQKSQNLYDSLIVVPHTLFKQWQDTITTHTTLKAHFLKTQRDLDKDSLITNLQTSHLTLVSNTLLSLFLNNLRARDIENPTWRRVFFDEADTIKLTSTCPFPNANMTWYITATYTNMLLANCYYHSYVLRQLPQEFLQTLAPEIQRLVSDTVDNHPHVQFFRTQSYQYFQDHLKGLHPLRGWLVVRSTDAFLEESIQLPTLHQQIIRCQPPLTHQVLESAIPAEVETMLHAGDIQGALQTLGVCQHTPTTIVEAITQLHVQKLDRLKRLYAFKQEEPYSNEQAKESALVNLRENIHRLEAQIQGIHQRLEQASKEVCAICYESPDKPVLTPCCSKLFCGSCMLNWMIRLPACPLCRASLHPTELKQLGDIHIPSTNTSLPKKQDALLNILQEHPNGKFLVFSKYENPLLQIQQHVDQHFPCQALQGNKDQVAKQLAAFEEGNLKVLFLSSRFAAAGLNIPSATHVILYHKMGMEDEKQILGRAYRLGRKDPLHIIKLLHVKE